IDIIEGLGPTDNATSRQEDFVGREDEACGPKTFLSTSMDKKSSWTEVPSHEGLNDEEVKSGLGRDVCGKPADKQSGKNVAETDFAFKGIRTKESEQIMAALRSRRVEQLRHFESATELELFPAYSQASSSFCGNNKPKYSSGREHLLSKFDTRSFCEVTQEQR
ncbi:unnamed protein product, partial [Protopolystoma xenopodis]